mmetsp:Transcript_1055/g.1861  ORF Transcript_1055/g.1861 Transcript_1055/m.1861 type:complete len:205 (+) Transcript_1055:722-1336(+)
MWFWYPCANKVGSANDIQQKVNKPILMVTPFMANFCSFSPPTVVVAACTLTLVRPPKQKDIPSTNRRFERMDPNKVHFTTSVRCATGILVARRVFTVIIISTTLPKVAFSIPATASFLMATANSSVASPRILANGRSAMKFKMKVQPSPQCEAEYAPRGTNTRRTEKGDQKISIRPSRFALPALRDLLGFLATSSINGTSKGMV